MPKSLTIYWYQNHGMINRSFELQAGFTQENPEALKLAIQTQAISTEAVEEKINEYGTFYQVEADLIGVNGTILSVITIWLERQIDGKFQFVTLKPSKGS
jgi:hypothetical protein